MNFFRTLISLCSGFAAYRAVRDLPLSSSVKYLLRLMSLLAALLIVSFIPVLLRGIAEFTTWAEGNLPPFRIQNGQVTAQVAQPYVAGDQTFLFILDTSGTITNPPPTAPQGILIGARSYLVWVQDTNAPTGFHTRAGSFYGFPDGDVSPAYLRQLMYRMLPVALPVALLVAILVGLLITLLQSYLFAVVGTLLERPAGGQLTLSQLLNIALHAVTPGAIIVTAYLAWQLEGLNLGLIYLIVFGVFLVGATNACREGETPER